MGQAAKVELHGKSDLLRSYLHSFKTKIDCEPMIALLTLILLNVSQLVVPWTSLLDFFRLALGTVLDIDRLNYDRGCDFLS